MELYQRRLALLSTRYHELIQKPNRIDTSWTNGVFDRWVNPVVTHEHAPIFWRYDLNPQTNPYLMERIGVNAALNAGAIEFGGKICLVVRVEGADRKSFFAVAESENGVDNFVFRDYPLLIDETEDPDTNVYDMRLTKHEDGWIYGLFCSERKDPAAAEGDTSSAVAQCGIVRTRDLQTWERLPDLKSGSPQQRNVVLHPEFVEGKYALYTRPQDDFLQAGTGGGIGFALSNSMCPAVALSEPVMDARVYHTIKEVKNGAGAPPIKTAKGWLHIAHGVRDTAAGLRYVIYAFLADSTDPSHITHRPGGYLIAPYEAERVGDVSNVVFMNGLVARENGEVFIYYASSDTRMHVATTTIDKLLDYVINTPEDPLRSRACVEQRNELIRANLERMAADPALNALASAF